MKGTDIAKEIIEEFKPSRPVIIYGDPDPDGLYSLLFCCNLFDEVLHTKYSYFVNDRRQHGFKVQPSTLRGYLVVAVDFDINQEMMQTLVDNDVAIVSFDHHNIQDEFIYVESDKTSARGVVINNQYPFEDVENRYQSGAGVVYEAFCEMYPEFKSDLREVLVGVTLLTDTRPIENERAKKYLKKTYSASTQSGYVHYLMECILGKDYGFGVPRLDRNFIDYNLSPKINSLLRFGKLSEAINFVLGKGLRVTDTQAKQTNLLSKMKERAYTLHLSHLTVVAIDVAEFLDFGDVDLTCFIGCLCSNIKGTGVSTLGIVLENGKVTRASFRGRYDDICYLVGFQNLGIGAEGHHNAFGITNFSPDQSTWIDLNDLIMQLEENHKQTIKVIETGNLSFTMLQIGMSVANENCYVRDMYRTYIRYTGHNAKIVKCTYKSEPLTDEERNKGIQADFYSSKQGYKYLRDSNGNPIIKFIEYIIDGKQVKSFGVKIEEGLILPILEKGHVQLYVRDSID